MTAKRFRNEDNCWGYYTEIIDEQKELDLSIPNPKKNLTIEELVDLLNDFDEHIKELKQEVELLREGLEAYEDNLPVYLTCKEVMDFHSDIYDFKKKHQSFYNEHPNRCKIIVDGVELK